MFKKLLMAASLVVTLFAQSAMAGTWTASATTTIFAAEIFGAATVAIDPGTADYKLAATPGSGAAFNVDYTLSGGTWGGCVFDVDQIIKTLEAGKEVLRAREKIVPD